MCYFVVVAAAVFVAVVAAIALALTITNVVLHCCGQNYTLLNITINQNGQQQQQQ